MSIPTLSELLRSARPGSLGLRLATSLIVAVYLVQCALVFKKRKQPHASVESSRIPEWGICFTTRDCCGVTHFLCLWSQGIYGQRARNSVHSRRKARTDPSGEFWGTKRSTESRPREARVVKTVVFIQSQKACQLSAECTLLDLSEKNGVQIPYGCRQGLCGKCATRVLSGPVQMDVEPV